MNEINIQLNSNQLALFKAARTEYAKNMREIANVRQQTKDDVECLFDGLGFVGKEFKEQRKVVKKALALYAKQTAAEEKAVFDEVFELASI